MKARQIFQVVGQVQAHLYTEKIVRTRISNHKVDVNDKTSAHA